MERPLSQLRPFGPFVSYSSAIEPDYYIMFDFEPEQWMIDLDNRDMHKMDIEKILAQPAGSIEGVQIRYLEKLWDDRELVKEYEDTFPVSSVNVPMIELRRGQSEANDRVIELISEYIEDQGGEYENAYATD